ncbi:hypothetical protein WICPIJ_007503 [Wickerhamomyces pijperi]|uniref:Scavenger mRNA decapping enzyme n=1 Tax=Wickerhamomyces pijperi TaxID=599730 RepID=A0A9P8Q1P2_WICPI|nr:hypothetical protein WICPIJ_007503 [Wickerhamomyces pijperi]
MTLKELVSKFNFERVLDSNPQTKSLVLLGSIESQSAIISLEKTPFSVVLLGSIESQSAIISLEKTPFSVESQSSSETVSDLLKRIDEVKLNTINDIYHWGLSTLVQDLEKNASAKLNLIYPATAVHIKKYAQQQQFLINETPEMYVKYVEPYIQTMIGDRIKWVRNILFEGAEAEKTIYKDPIEDKEGFNLSPDMKWDGVNMDSLYLLAIVYREDVRSLRDLNISHQKWLREVNAKIRKIVADRYKGQIKPDQLRLFVHYQPSYYHFHIHVVNILHPGLGNGIAAGKAILLEDVIEQLSFLGEKGFKNRTISYVIGENHDLWKLGLKGEHEKSLSAY